jgi:hypothetical protein
MRSRETIYTGTKQTEIKCLKCNAFMREFEVLGGSFCFPCARQQREHENKNKVLKIDFNKSEQKKLF